VVVPAFREAPDILERCLDSWLSQDPAEIIVVPDLRGRGSHRPPEHLEDEFFLGRRACPAMTGG